MTKTSTPLIPLVLLVPLILFLMTIPPALKILLMAMDTKRCLVDSVGTYNKLPRPKRPRYFLSSFRAAVLSASKDEDRKLCLHERADAPILGSMYSLAFISGLIVHGALRANIKCNLAQDTHVIFVNFSIFSNYHKFLNDGLSN